MSQQKSKSHAVVDREGHPTRTLPKVSSGIPGLDEITHGGLPRERTTLICGAAGAGKSLFSLQFLVRGVVDHDEPGALISFEEPEEDIALNAASLGFNLQALIDQNKLAMDHVRVEHSEVTKTGAFNLDGLFLRIESAIEKVGAKRVVIDTLESLFGGLTDYVTLRSELRRLFRWLKDRGVTAIVTAERGDGALTQNRLEEYVSDCVILLDHRVSKEISTRRLRVVKYRGSTHGTNEYPFLIDETGITVMPITSAALKHTVSNERISTGIQRLDSMLGGHGYYRGSTILASGTAGAGKSSIAAHFADAVCRRGECCIIFAFEESADQIKRNMASIGLDLARHETEGLLHIGGCSSHYARLGDTSGVHAQACARLPAERGHHRPGEQPAER
jgi:circadian clock protein KaiC